MSAEPITISVKAASKLYGLSENSFRKLLHRKDFPSLKVGRRILIIKTQLLEYMERLARGEEADPVHELHGGTALGNRR